MPDLGTVMPSKGMTPSKGGLSTQSTHHFDMSIKSQIIDMSRTLHGPPGCPAMFTQTVMFTML
jgi:hypothetical protein